MDEDDKKFPGSFRHTHDGIRHIPDREVFAPGAFKGTLGQEVPLTWENGGPVIGTVTSLGDGSFDMHVTDERVKAMLLDNRMDHLLIHGPPVAPLEENPGFDTRPWGVWYGLAYDGGGEEFTLYYRTKFGASVARLWHKHVSSWGGQAILFANSYRGHTKPEKEQ